ncbi:MAG: hypothetical protein ACREH4_11760 [Vitreimonas sp.]
MLIRKLVVVGLVGIVSFAANFATAEDAGAPQVNYVGLDGVDFVDPSNVFADNRFEFTLSEGAAPRFSNLTPVGQDRASSDPNYRGAELAVTARGAAGIDVTFAQRAGVGFNRQGDVERRSRASELRLGRGLGMRRDEPSREPRWYIFAASEDEALTWGPPSRTEFGGAGSSFSVEDRVEIGDIQAGITYERDGWQASFAYVEREVSARTGSRTISHDQDFTGITFTMRH